MRINFTNTGQESHHAQFVRLNEGVTMEQFQGALQQAPEAAFTLVTFEGGPAPIGPGDSAEVVADLGAGQYVLLCFVPDPDGVPHLAKGMIRPVTVTAPSGDAPSTPKADVVVKMADFSFADAPAEIDAGKSTWRVENVGQQAHEMGVLRLEGVSAAEFPLVLAAMGAPDAPPPSGPPPLATLGAIRQ